MPITEILDRNCKLYGNDICLVEINPEIQETRRVTWKEYELIQPTSSAPYRRQITWQVFDEKANRAANLLLERGIRKGQKVAILLMNCLDWLPIYFGVLKAGAIAVPLNFRYSADEIEYCVKLAEADILIFGPEFIGRVEEIADNISSHRLLLFIGSTCPSFAEDFGAQTANHSSKAPDVTIDEDDYGAINEAMSDILGNLCEAVCAKEGAADWLVGEDTGFAMRNMLDPHAFGQPEYVWDLYYAPNAWTPGDANDMGGVHANSSILNRVAARLCAEYGMDLTEAVNFWLTAACGMTPRTNYYRMPALLEWALEASDGERFAQALSVCVSDARMTASAQEPETLPEGTRLVRLTLPETGGQDGLMLIALQLDSEEIFARLKALGGFLQTAWNAVRSGRGSGLGQAWKDLLSRLDMEELTDALLSGDMEQAKAVFLDSMQGLLTERSTWRQTDGRTVSMVVRNLPTVYLLIDMSDLTEAYSDMDSYEDPESEAFGGMAVLAGDKWIDLAGLLSALPAEDEDGQDLSDEQAAWMESILEPLGTLALGLVEEMLTGQQADNGVIELPTAGLEALWAASANPAA